MMLNSELHYNSNTKL